MSKWSYKCEHVNSMPRLRSVDRITRLSRELPHERGGSAPRLLCRETAAPSPHCLCRAQLGRSLARRVHGGLADSHATGSAGTAKP